MINRIILLVDCSMNLQSDKLLNEFLWHLITCFLLRSFFIVLFDNCSMNHIVISC